ncbi:hypothetical protein [Micropruina sonneratiae]|uniref:hypothetical protein n=1 Tax=Micropruina sonneratiae TaxID=2986940 RepID=UPI0022269D24|nr:hypothetical protein [Micropruina sp. KQZ13P-5]MCW3159567.1 hypothetical protein [Micropruina sp. KQZ13P-5]
MALNLEAALVGVVVRVHDDGSKDGMHDLDLVRDGRIFGCCEVTSAADEATIEFWNVANGGRQGRWTEPDLVGGWSIAARPTARVNKLRTALPEILRDMERNGVCEVDEWGREAHASRLRSLGVVEAHQGPTTFPGSIYLTVDLPSERLGGAVPDSGNDLASWVGEWLALPEQRHNLDKLRRADRDEQHMAILFPGFTTAPFVATDVLMRPNGPLPSITPELPPGINHLWLMSTWSTGDVFHWTGTDWVRHPKVAPADSP